MRFLLQLTITETVILIMIENSFFISDASTRELI